MQNGSARFISRFKFVIGAAVVATTVVATTVALLSNPVPLNSQAVAAGVAQFDASTDLTVAEGTTGMFDIDIGSLTAQSRLSLSIESSRTAAITGTQKDVTITVGSTNVTTFPHTIVVESSTVSTDLQISVTATDDSFYEGNEEFTFKLETVMNGNITIGTAASRKLIVGDNDNATYAITFQSGQSELREMGTSGTADVGLNVAITNGDTDGVPADHTVTLNNVDGITFTAATIMAGSNSADFDASRANDSLYKGNFNVTISTTSGGGSLVVPVIEDDTPAYAITFQSGQSELNENSHVGLNVEITNVDPDGVVARHDVALEPVSSLSRGPTTVSIPANGSSVTFNVLNPKNDSDWSGNFNATIRTTTGGGSLEIPVIDDDIPKVTIVAADGSDPITVTEGESNTDNLTLEITNVSGSLLGETTFKLERNSSMSTTGSDDMVADVTVPAGMSSANFSFNAGANIAFDPGIYVLEVHAAESLGKMVTPSGSSVSIVIVDRNPLPITFTVDKTSVAEDDADKTVTFRASIAPLPSLSYDLGLVVTRALTRVTADDVDMIPNGLTITMGTDYVEYKITVEDDDQVEIDELFKLEIIELRYRGGVSRNAGGAALTSTVFTIVSDDTASWSLSAANTMLAEGTSIAVTITSDKPLPTLADPPTVSIEVLNSAGVVVISAAIPRTSQLYRGEKTDVINIPNPHDDLFELNQMYTVRLASSSILGVLPVGSVGDPITYTVTDDPNEMPDITLDYGATTVDEGGMITVSITVDNAPDTGLGDGLYVQLAFNTMDSTASAADISFQETGILIPMGQRSASIEIQANDDGMFDPGEVFALSVNNVWYGHSNRPMGMEVTVGTFVSGGTIRVVDKNAPDITLTRVGDKDVEEADIEKTFTITLNAAVAVDLILAVDFDGTATRNTDYSAPDNVTIPAGEMSVNYTVTVTADADAEFDETVELLISGGTTSDLDRFTTLVPQPSAAFTITNDDMVTVTLVGPASAISESTATQIDITLSIPLPPSSSLPSYTWETLSGSNFEDISSLDGVRSLMTVEVANRDFSNLGFDFEFYGQCISRSRFNTNGYLTFTDDDQRLRTLSLRIILRISDFQAVQRWQSTDCGPFWG